VAEVSVKVHQAGLDPGSKQVWLHTETTVGLSDGSARPGVSVTHFINGAQAFEAVTDDFGVAKYEGGVSADLFRASGNMINVRIKGSSKGASEGIALLAESTARIVEARDYRVSEREGNRFSYEYREVSLVVAVRLSLRDFKQPAGARFRVNVGGQDMGEYYTGADGTFTLTRTFPYEVETWHRQSGADERSGAPPVRVSQTSPLVITFPGLPETLAIRVNA
jgi:hypothetical protein